MDRTIQSKLLKPLTSLHPKASQASGPCQGLQGRHAPGGTKVLYVSSQKVLGLQGGGFRLEVRERLMPTGGARFFCHGTVL